MASVLIETSLVLVGNIQVYKSNEMRIGVLYISLQVRTCVKTEEAHKVKNARPMFCHSAIIPADMQ